MEWSPGFNYKLSVDAAEGSVMDVVESWADEGARNLRIYESKPTRSATDASPSGKRAATPSAKYSEAAKVGLSRFAETLVTYRLGGCLA